MALIEDRDLVMRNLLNFEGPMAASAECFVGALLVRDTSGNVKPGTAAASLIACGFCTEYALESTGVAAASNVKYRIGCGKMKNSSSNPADKSHVGDTLYIEDDETVTTDSSGTSAAGICVDVESDGVWVLVLPQNLAATGLLAANNLSDVGSASTAATNLGLGTGDSPTFTDVTTTDDVTVGDDLVVTGLATIGETLGVTGITTLAGLLNADGGIAVDTNKFTVSAAGAVVVASTLGVTGVTTLVGALNADGGIAVDTNKFTVSAAGVVTIASTLAVSGATTLSALLNADGGIACDTDKFTVANGTGNTVIAGTLAVGSAATKVVGTVGLDFNDCRVHDNLAALLPVAGATDDLGNVPGTVGTTAPSLQTEDLKAAGATDNKATFFLKVPDWYLAGSTLALVCNAGMITTVSDTTATLDVEAWVPDYANADGSVSSDLCTTAAQSINSLTFANKSFTIDDDVAGHEIAAGDILQFRITTAVNDGATGTAVIAAIRKIHLAVSA